MSTQCSIVYSGVILISLPKTRRVWGLRHAQLARPSSLGLGIPREEARSLGMGKAPRAGGVVLCLGSCDRTVTAIMVAHRLLVSSPFPAPCPQAFLLTLGTVQFFQFTPAEGKSSSADVSTSASELDWHLLLPPLTLTRWLWRCSLAAGMVAPP